MRRAVVLWLLLRFAPGVVRAIYEEAARQTDARHAGAEQHWRHLWLNAVRESVRKSIDAYERGYAAALRDSQTEPVEFLESKVTGVTWNAPAGRRPS